MGRDSNQDGYSDVLGPYGLEARNDKGRDLLQVYLTNKLSIMNTFFRCADPHHVRFSQQREDEMYARHDSGLKRHIQAGLGL